MGRGAEGGGLGGDPSAESGGGDADQGDRPAAGPRAEHGASGAGRGRAADELAAIDESEELVGNETASSVTSHAHELVAEAVDLGSLEMLSQQVGQIETKIVDLQRSIAEGQPVQRTTVAKVGEAAI
ncbi:MAG: hypothetical protein QOE59_3593 [Actinomycetota bacterium]|nr:hypothetical protein [Actinomycetota bacterium]